MKELKSEQLAQLVSLGGWLRGAEALSALVLQNYSREDAELLRQPALLAYFDERLARMSGDLRADPIVVRMRQGMQRVRPLIASGDAQSPRQMVKEIGAVCEELLTGLRGRRRVN